MAQRFRVIEDDGSELWLTRKEMIERAKQKAALRPAGPADHSAGGEAAHGPTFQQVVLELVDSLARRRVVFPGDLSAESRALMDEFAQEAGRPPIFGRR